MLVADNLAHWVPADGDSPPLRRLTCGGLLDEAAASWPDHDGLVYCAYGNDGPEVRWSFAELRRRARAVAKALLANGLTPGDRLALWATNVPEWILLQFGCAYAGVVLVPLNPLYRAAEVGYVLRRSSAAALVVEPANRGVNLWDLALEAAADAPDLRSLIALGGVDASGGISWDEFLSVPEDVDDSALDGLTVRPGDLAQIQFTSGTTGFPKGAMLRHGALTDNARLFASRAELPPHGGVCSGMPQFHCGGSVLATMGAFAVGSALMPLVTFDARKAIDTIDGERAKFLAAVPAMLLAIEAELARGGGSLESLERIATGGSLVPPEIGRRWHEHFGVTFTITYGLTEASPVITQSSPSDSLELQIGTVGRPLPHVECDVADPLTGETVAIGERGEVRVRGWQVMAGYFGDADATSEAITPDGWLRTGDLGQLDAEGYLRITGRAKDMIIRGGENIYPAEIEAALRQIDGVAEAAVVGVPDDRYGEVPAAFVTLGDGAALTLESMRDALGGRIARFKLPAHLRVRDALPLTASGKVQKYKLREEFADEASRSPALQGTASNRAPLAS
jgi:acyl-CoA synthetase (AMP-forming)/AMP-acid ligase II